MCFSNRQKYAYAKGATVVSTIANQQFNGLGYLTGYTLNDVGKTLLYDRLGNLKTLSDTGSTANDQTYLYDGLNRLTDFAAPGTTQHYDYDKVGNRITKTVNASTLTSYTIDPASNQITNVNGTAYPYDLAGNLTSDGSNTYQYDARNRLTYAKNANGVVYTYGINALGQRVSKTSTALSTGGRVYVYDEAGHLIGEYDNTGARVLEYIWLDDQPVALVGSGGGLFYILSDHLNTPRQIVDGNNQLRWRWDNVDPFGNNAPNNNPLGLGAFTFNMRFPGQYADSETGLFYNGFRSYSPKLGRYTQSDPIGLRGGLNTYGYVGGNPVNHTDPSGLIIDTIADAGFILYDLYKLASDGACERNSNLTALGLDFIGAITPGVTGLGAASRVVAKPLFKTTKEAALAASELGFKRVKETVNGQAVFRKGNNYITRDVDGHKGGAWKIADSVRELASKETCSGTFNADLTKRIGD